MLASGWLPVCPASPCPTSVPGSPSRHTRRWAPADRLPALPRSWLLALDILFFHDDFKFECDMQRVGLVHDLIGELEQTADQRLLWQLTQVRYPHEHRLSHRVLDRDQLERRWRQLLEGPADAISPHRSALANNEGAIERRQMILREP